jgi:hypothetical protein
MIEIGIEKIVYSLITVNLDRIILPWCKPL